MSEYQYYEFAAIDRPLSAEQRQQLRAISSRARITAASFVNSYNFGDLRADPLKLLERYFDVFVYVANWGTRWFAMRLPRRLVDLQALKSFQLDDDVVLVRSAGEHVIISITRNEVDDEEWADGSGHLAALAPLRAELLAGDLRLFSLLWLMQVEYETIPDAAVEPAPGLGRMSGALAALAEFLAIDPDLVEAATGAGTPRRKAGELRAAARRIAEERDRIARQRADRERRLKEEREARARKQRLSELAKRGEAAWREVEDLIVMRNASAYEQAAVLLADLGKIADDAGKHAEFARRLAELHSRHERKRQFIARLNEAGLVGSRAA